MVLEKLWEKATVKFFLDCRYAGQGEAGGTCFANTNGLFELCVLSNKSQQRKKTFLHCMQEAKAVRISMHC